MRIKDLIGFLDRNTCVILYQRAFGSDAYQNLFIGAFGKVPSLFHSAYIENIQLYAGRNTILEIYVDTGFLRRR